MRIDQSQFCSLSGDGKFQQWLKIADNALYEELMETRRTGRGCRANSEKMRHVYAQLYQHSKGDQLEAFISKNYPSLIVRDREDTKGVPTYRPAPPMLRAPRRQKIISPTNTESLNKHKVFGSYRPHIMTFPQKRILVNSNRRQLEASVRQFLQGKMSTDYIIIEDRAYIEFFDAKFTREAAKIPQEHREIHQYRARNNLL